MSDVVQFPDVMAPRDVVSSWVGFWMCRCLFEGILLACGINYALGSKSFPITYIKPLRGIYTICLTFNQRTQSACAACVYRATDQACCFCRQADGPAYTGGLDMSAEAAQDVRDHSECYPRYAQQMCAVNDGEKVLTVLLMACAYIYFALYFYHLFQALLKLKDLPRQDNKMASLQIRLQVCLAEDVCPTKPGKTLCQIRKHAGCVHPPWSNHACCMRMQLKIRILVVAFYTLSIALLWFVKLDACRSYCYTWYGMLPAQVGCRINPLSYPCRLPCKGSQQWDLGCPCLLKIWQTVLTSKQVSS